MKIYKNQYDKWQTTAHNTELNGEKVEYWMDIQFARGSEPIGELEGKLIFRSDDGTEREGFFSSYRKKDGTVRPKLVLKVPTDAVDKYQYNIKATDIPTTIDEEDVPW